MNYMTRLYILPLWDLCVACCIFFFFKQKTAYEMRISDWSSDVCSSDLGKVFVHAGLEQDVMAFQQFLGAPQFQIVRTERRTAITGDEAASIQPITLVDFLLHHGKAPQRMGAAPDHPPVLDSIFIIQFSVTQDRNSVGTGKSQYG